MRRIDESVQQAAASDNWERPELRELLWNGHYAEARAALATVEVADRHDLERWLAWTYPALAGRPGIRPVPSTQPWLRPAAQLASDLARGSLQQAAERAAPVLNDLDRARCATGWGREAALLALSALMAAGRPSAAESWGDRVLTGPLLAGNRAEAALRQGRLRAALDHGAHVDLGAWGVAVGLPLSTLILAATRCGDLEAAARHVAHPVPEAMSGSRYGVVHLYARGEFRLAAARPDAALSDFLACGRRLRRWGLEGVVAWRVGAAEAFLRLGRPDQTRTLLDDQLAHPASAHTRGLALRLLARSSPAAARPPLLAEALELFEACEDRYEQARVLTDAGRTHDELGDRRRARMISRRARNLAAQTGAASLCDELMVAPAAVGPAAPARRRTSEELTESERRVAALAVQGLTNREIAARLYITASTVEQHLTRVYRKHGVKQRRDLPASLSDTAVRQSS